MTIFRELLRKRLSQSLRHNCNGDFSNITHSRICLLDQYTPWKKVYVT